MLTDKDDNSKENTVLRAALDPSTVSVIPNAVVAENFRPDPTAASPDHSELPKPFEPID